MSSNETTTSSSSVAGVVAAILLLVGGAFIGAIVAHKVGPKDGSGLLAGKLIIPFSLAVAFILIEVLRHSSKKARLAEKLPKAGVDEANLPTEERMDRRLAIAFLPTVPVVAGICGWFVSDIYHMFGVAAFAGLGLVFGILAYTLAQFGLLPRMKD